MNDQIRFEDGAGYQRFMGRWSQLAGARFLDWLQPVAGGRWLDVGCGNGAFTELIVGQCAPASVTGIDPSAAQLAFARTQPALRDVDFRLGDAMALPFIGSSFDAAVMPLVIFFVPVPAKGVSEMARVVSPGGLVTAYAWDLDRGGHPYAPLQAEMRDMGIDVPSPPSPEASRLDVLEALWQTAGLAEIETVHIVETCTFESFDDYWDTLQYAPSVGRTLNAMSADALAHLRERMRLVLPIDAAGRVRYEARANAVRGRVPRGPDKAV